MRLPLRFTAWLALSVLACPLVAAPSIWPGIQPTDRRVGIDLTGSMVDISLPILSSNGSPLYWLRCLGGSMEQLDAAGERDGENYVAPLACVLVAQPDGWAGNLLSEDESATWYSRGQFTGDDLAGDCGRYPEFGKLRHFRLRGMRLTLATEDVKTGREGLVGLTLHVTVAKDPSAQTAIAERPGYLAPKGGDCQVVRRGAAPLMCRNKDTSSWQACTSAQKHDMGYPEADHQ
jgi:hypothetical protein